MSQTLQSFKTPAAMKTKPKKRAMGSPKNKPKKKGK